MAERISERQTYWIDHDLVVKAVRVHTDLPWVVLYARRWLTAPMRHPRRHLATARSR